jgi:hypothetical protein
MYIYFFTSPYVSSLKEPVCIKRPLPDRYFLVRFIPKGKGYVFKLLFPEFLCGKDRKHLIKLRELWCFLDLHDNSNVTEH